MADYYIRTAVAADEPFLWQMLYHAARMHEDGAAGPEVAKSDPFLCGYVAEWGKETDIGVIAELADGTPVGAAWARVLDTQGHGLPHVRAGAAEIAIAVLPELIGGGIGGALLAALIAAANGRCNALALSVRADNPAVRLYQRHGFVVVAEMQNRVGTNSVVMERAQNKPYIMVNQ